MDDRESERSAWVRVFSAVLASWPATLRAGFLLALLVVLLVVIRLLALDVTIGPVEIGSPE